MALSTDESSNATLTGVSLPVATGTHMISAYYPGDANNAPSRSPAVALSADRGTPTGTLSASTESAGFGTPVILTATISGSASVPSGGITFADGVEALGTVNLTSTGTAVYTANTLSLGAHTITASYSGNTYYYAINLPSIPVTVTQGTQTINFPVIAPQIVGTSLTLAATATSGLAVSYSSTTSAICTVSGSTAALIAPGTCTIQATQNGNINHSPATPVSNSFAVSLPTTAPPTFSLASGTYTSAQTVALSDSTSGTVIYYTTNGQLPNTSSTRYSGPITVAATQTINAVAVAPNHSQSNVSTATYTIAVLYATNTVVESSANPSALGQSVSFTASVDSASGIAPTGIVTFMYRSGVMGTGQLADGVATFSTSSLPFGEHSITARYNGNATNNPSVSFALDQIVLAPTSIAVASSANPATPGPSSNLYRDRERCVGWNSDRHSHLQARLDQHGNLVACWRISEADNQSRASGILLDYSQLFRKRHECPKCFAPVVANC